MTSFRTEVTLPPSPLKLGLKDSMLTIGSCFSDSIGIRLSSTKINALVNPFGVVYNPLSIHKLLTLACNSETPAEDGYVQQEDIVYHTDFHSALSAFSKDALKQELDSALHNTHTFICMAKCIIITYGTAWVYEDLDRKQVVANCHKRPSRFFHKKLLQPDEIANSFNQLTRIVRQHNNDIRFILTVSPVRHVKDTLPLNAVSKSILRVAAHSICSSHANVEYFPSYEMMVDDLRDYRFYKADMIHPTEQAEDYIWEKFLSTYYDNETISFVKEWRQIQTALHHKPFHPASSGHKNFLQRTIKKLEELQYIVNVNEELRTLQEQLNRSVQP